MACFFYTIIETIYYLFIALLINKFNDFSMISSAFILLAISVFLGIANYILLHFLKDRKKFFIASSLLIIAICSIFHIWGENILNIFGIKSGIINFTMYMYKIIYMLSPFLSLYFLGIHKLFYKQQKKQLYLLIAIKRFFPILIILVTSYIFNFSSNLYILAVFEFIFNLLFLLYSHKINKICIKE